MIAFNDLIERWANAERVLMALPELARTEQWDMSTWGRMTGCGTVACAAGHCGMDPWFRDRGFRLDFVDGSAEISDVQEFFGLDGANQVFYDPTARPVETVIEEVRLYTLGLRRVADLTAAAPYRIGEEWPGQGGVFAGACAGVDGRPDYYLIVGPESDAPLTWDDAGAWVSGLEIEGQRDSVLPLRREQRILYDRVRSLFEPDWYWSGEQHASLSITAWGQDFSYGGQSYWDKYRELRARAVRRLTIQ